MNYLKQLASQTAIYGLSSVIPRLLNYLLVPLYTRVFLPEEYGIVTELYAYLGLLLVLLTYGMETGFFRFATKSEESELFYSTAFFSLLISSTFFVILASFFSNSIVSILGYENHSEYVIYLAIVIGLDAFCAIPFAKLRLENKALTFAYIKISGVILNILLNLFFLVICPKYVFFQNIGVYYVNYQIEYVFISNLLSSVLTTILLLFTSRPKFFLLSISKFKVLFFYSFPLLISGLGGTTNETLDRIFIKYLIPSEENPLYQLGIYGSNVKLAVIMILFIQMYRYAAEPFFFSNANKSDSLELYSNMLKYFFIFSLFIFLSVGLFTDVLSFLVGKQFREGLDVVPILLLVNLFSGVFFNLSIWYKLKNKTWYGIYYTFAGAILTVSLNFLLIPKIGYYGAAFSRLACYILMCFLCYNGGKAYLAIPYNLKILFKYLLFALFLFIIGFLIHIDNFFLSIFFRLFLIFAFIVFLLHIEKIKFINILNFFKWK